MINQGWSFVTLDRTKMNTWTRKRRNKFKKRWMRQHGSRFGWTKAVYEHSDMSITDDTFTAMILHQREQ